MKFITFVRENPWAILCISISFLATYGKFFVDTTEMTRLNSTIIANCSLILGFLFIIENRLKVLIAEIKMMRSR